MKTLIKAWYFYIRDKIHLSPRIDVYNFNKKTRCLKEDSKDESLSLRVRENRKKHYDLMYNHYFPEKK